MFVIKKVNSFFLNFQSKILSIHIIFFQFGSFAQSAQSETFIWNLILKLYLPIYMIDQTTINLVLTTFHP